MKISLDVGWITSRKWVTTFPTLSLCNLYRQARLCAIYARARRVNALWPSRAGRIASTKSNALSVCSLTIVARALFGFRIFLDKNEKERSERKKEKSKREKERGTKEREYLFIPNVMRTLRFCKTGLYYLSEFLPMLFVDILKRSRI